MSVLSVDELTQAHIADVDSKIKELAEMLPFSAPVTRKTFLNRIDYLLDQRLEFMKEGGRC